MSNQSYDVVISGGGLVGLTTALTLSTLGLRCCVIEYQPKKPLVSYQYDGRNSALSRACCDMFQNLGLWDRIARYAQPINDILVSDGTVQQGASSLFLHFNHKDIGDEPLGHFVENRFILKVLHEAIAEQNTIDILYETHIIDSPVTPTMGQHSLKLNTGDTLDAPLLLVCEGKKSPLRTKMGFQTYDWSYDQVGIVTTVIHEQPHNGIAQEFFLPSGPFAILPLPDDEQGQHRCSLVWTETTAMAKALLSLTSDLFEYEMKQRFGQWLGDVQCTPDVWSYPLTLQRATKLSCHRTLLMGDAAHTLHPVAGQGFNLGMRDVATLKDVLENALRTGLDIGSPSVIEDYVRWRNTDITSLAVITDGLVRLFSNSNSVLTASRRMGLGIIEKMSFSKKFFMSHAAGLLGDRPSILQNN